ILEHAQQHDLLTDVTLYHEDYLQSWGRTHANIVCNPPYMRFQKFRNRDVVARLFRQHLGLRLSGHTNTASAFLLKSLSELDGSGRLAYLMPLEFLNAGYGTVVKQQLLQHGQLVAVISLQCEQDVFPEAITTVGLILVDAANHHDSVAFYTLDDLDDLADFAALAPTNVVATSELDPAAKWQHHLRPPPVAPDLTQLVPFEFYGHFSRGIATGANEFFTLTPARAGELGLQRDELQPCIARSAQVRQGIFTDADLQALRQRDAPMLLLTASIPPSAAAISYLKQGEAKGYHQRFLTRHRKPWYRSEQREPAPLWLGVFSRGDYKVVLNRTDALHLTCFHGFQPNLFGQRHLHALFLYLLSATGRAVMALSLRQYGDGLDKFEPNDLNAALVPAPVFFDTLDTQQIESALQHISEGGTLPPALETAFASITTTTRSSA
ncbi:MAG TPA: hypothetical protein VMH83_02675, partial [Candidatus Acidoferrum sp.]|nr:hypothetical protein [Candidatus Acidoferrum sp.]